MEVLGIPALMKYGTGVVVLFLLLLNVYTAVVLNMVSRSLAELKKNVVFKDTHDETEKRWNERIESIVAAVQEIRRKVFNGGYSKSQ